MKQRILKRDKDFFEATLRQVKVSVYSKGYLVDDEGVIENYSPVSVKLKGTYYMRDQYEFRVDVKDSSA